MIKTEQIESIEHSQGLSSVAPATYSYEENGPQENIQQLLSELGGTLYLTNRYTPGEILGVIFEGIHTPKDLEAALTYLAKNSLIHTSSNKSSVRIKHTPPSVELTDSPTILPALRVLPTPSQVDTSRKTGEVVDLSLNLPIEEVDIKIAPHVLNASVIRTALKKIGYFEDKNRSIEDLVSIFGEVITREILYGKEEEKQVENPTRTLSTLLIVALKYCSEDKDKATTKQTILKFIESLDVDGEVKAELTERVEKVTIPSEESTASPQYTEPSLEKVQKIINLDVPPETKEEIVKIAFGERVSPEQLLFRLKYKEFTTSHPQAITRNSLYGICGELGIEDLTAHDFTHSFTKIVDRAIKTMCLGVINRYKHEDLEDFDMPEEGKAKATQLIAELVRLSRVSLQDKESIGFKIYCFLYTRRVYKELVSVTHTDFDKLSLDIAQHTLHDQEMLATLSDQERGVLSMRHKAYGQIGLELDIANSTIRTHVTSIKQKTGLNSLGQIGLAIRQLGLLDSIDISIEQEKLSDRERDIALLLVKGRLYHEIANDFGISISTVRTHLHNIYQKLGVTDKFSAAAILVKIGYILPSELGAEATSKHI